MDYVALFYAIAVAWFSFICLRITVFIYQFASFPRSFGRVTNVSLTDLAGLSRARDEDLPQFNIIVPAYLESAVIDGTLRRLAALNYPRGLITVWVVTYADEPAGEGATTQETARPIAGEINAASGREVIRLLSVPAEFDGGFPGRFDAGPRHVGKPRGLNFALRRLHERNERDERVLFLGTMIRRGLAARPDRALTRLSQALTSAPATVGDLAAALLDSASPDHIGPCCTRAQLDRFLALMNGAGQAAPARLRELLAAHIRAEAPRFFLEAVQAPTGQLTLEPMPQRAFLADIMASVEALTPEELSRELTEIEARLKAERPRLAAAFDRVRDPETLYQLSKRLHSRWVAVYDADADAPVDLLRHLAARILTDPEVMGFQGPVSPVANYDAVHPLCRLGALWMGFWHSTGYPRLMAKSGWAHVLAGTNWCFHIEGMRQGARLARSAAYDEAARVFVLSFDPRQLTEDLEVAVRVFDAWHANAAWHPFVEFEQVPATPRAMIRQRRRWTLGTLQTVSFILKSRLPLAQKLKYALLPLDIVFSGSGPIVTVILWALIWSGDLIASPALIAFSVLLTLGNIVYVVPYLMAHERFVMGLRRASGIDYLRQAGPGLAEALEARLAADALSKAEAEALHGIAALLRSGTAPRGFLTRYAQERFLDGPVPETPDGDAVRRWRADTPEALPTAELPDLAARLRRLSERCHTAMSSRASEDETLLRALTDMRQALNKAAGEGPWRRRRKRERWQIWRWAFLYLFWQLIPYYSGLIAWVTRRGAGRWDKTPRTRKSNLIAPD